MLPNSNMRVHLKPGTGATRGAPQKAPRAIVFTINNYTEDYLAAISHADYMDKHHVRYMLGAKERGESDTPHIQGYVEFDRAHRWAVIREFFKNKAHVLEAYADSDVNRKYILKGEQPHAEWDSHGTAGPTYGKNCDVWIEYGIPKSQGKRTDIAALVTTIKNGGDIYDVMDTHPELMLRMPAGIVRMLALQVRPRNYMDDPPVVIAHFGPTGTGKTKYVFDTYYDTGAATKKAAPIALMPSALLGSGWHDGYTGQKVALFDEFRGQCTFGHLLQLTDRYPTNVAIKGGSLPWNVDFIHLTSPVHPTLWYRAKLESNDGSLAQLQRRIITVYYHYHLDEEPLDLTNVPWDFFVDYPILLLAHLEHLEEFKAEVASAKAKYPNLKDGAFADHVPDNGAGSSVDHAQFPPEMDACGRRVF